ncbi:MAG TPA: universal stress protein [Catalimonadaceae bacterium]|nr:universal stress protein [Catalimonadaceae bacterium]
MVPRILVPTDFSSCADHASIEAIRLALKIGSRLTFIHFFSTPWVGSDTKLRFENSNRLHHHIVGLCEANQLKLPLEVDYYSKSGNVREGLVHFIAHHRVSLVVMGTKGGGSLNARIFGSNTVHLIRNGYTPVLAIPENSSLFPIKTIVYGSDYSDVTGITFDMVIKLAELLQAKVTILHLHPSQGERHHARDKFLDPDKRILSHKDIEKVSIKSDDVIKGIREYVDQTKPSFLALSVKEESNILAILRNSVFQTFILEARLPILAAR